ncbi:MAG TPA: galactokinase, partial [Gemmatimonadaceae bacterium]|nr:galactokinase [Gemmatimonadaceae bacterium]
LDNASKEIDLARIEQYRGHEWYSYVAGVAWSMQKAGMDVRGADLSINSTVPTGAGLSSSAALEIGVYRALAAVSGIPWDPVQAAKISRHAENQFVGVASGVMDQMASACSEAGSVTMIDCRSLQVAYVQIPEGAAIVVIDTGVRRRLATSEYNERREACERAVRQLQKTYPRIGALRDVTPGELSAAMHTLGAVEWHRASHVVAENQRVLDMIHVLSRGDLVRAGQLLNESHESLRDLYEVSSPELDAAVALAVKQPGCFGARMTGAGFGGCAIALVQALHAEAFVSAVPRSFQVTPSGGASLA